jgi:hypothetical protein
MSPFSLLVVTVLAAASFVAWPALQVRAFPLDDAWITQVIARNFASTGVWGFEPGVASSGATSPLWTLLMAPPHWIGFPAPATWSFLWSAALLAGFCAAVYALRRRDGDEPASAAALALLPAMLGNAAWLAATGLEPLLLAALTALAVLLWHRRSRWAGIACGLVVLVRPEGLVIGPTLVVLGWLDPARRRPSEIARLLGPVAPAAAGTSAFSWVTSGGWLPTTFEGRRWLFGAQEFDLQRSLDLVRAWASQLVERGLLAPRALALPIFALALVGAIGAFRRGGRLPAFGALVVCALALNVPYLAMLPNIGHGGRYQPMNLLLFVPLTALGIVTLSRRLAPRARGLAVAIPLAVALACVPSLAHWRATTRDGVAHIEDAHAALALWVAANVGRGEPIAAFDIGALAYGGKHRVLDLGGLVDRDYLPYLRSGRVPDWLREHDVRWLALPLDDVDGVPGLHLERRLGLAGRPDLPLEPVVEFATPREVWAPAFADTGHALPRLVLFRVADVGPSSRARAYHPHPESNRSSPPGPAPSVPGPHPAAMPRIK